MAGKDSTIPFPDDAPPDKFSSEETIASSGEPSPVLRAEFPAELGRYRVERLLGAGAFGRVYLAYDGDLDRRVAIKVAHPHRVLRPEDVETYLREARLAAKLHHPGIAPVYDVGRTQEGLCFVVSHFVEGGDLAKRIKDRPLAHREAAELIAAVAEALHHAHLQGLVHRDIKPANILLEKTGEPRVVDFGLAIHEADQRRRRGEVAGTPSYMAPEQVRGEAHRLDGRTDIWALGVVLYELLTGRLPFSGETRQELFDEIQHREPKPCRMIDDRIPRELERICLRCLRKPVDERYQTARDLADELRAAADGLGDGLSRSDPQKTLPPSPIPVEDNSTTLDDLVQFTVYRPKSVDAGRWYPLLAFAHLAERPANAPAETPDPLEEVAQQAERILGERVKQYAEVRQDSAEPIPQEGEITFLPLISGVEFNPPRRTFAWREAVHREEFHLRASAAVQGQRVRGRMSVFLGAILIAEVPLAFRVEAATSAESPPSSSEVVTARRFRRIYAAYAHADRPIVQQFESYARALGDQYLTHCRQLRESGRVGEELRRLIFDADVFQLFWSTNALNSPLVHDECEYALTLNRDDWIRPVYWETPLPEDPARGLPPAALRRFEFQQLLVSPHVAPAASDERTGSYRQAPPVGDDIDLAERAGESSPAPARDEERTVVSTEEPPPASIGGPPPRTSTLWRKGDKPIEGYTLERSLGRGALGEVWAARGPGGVGAALKRIKMLDSDSLKGQFRTLQRIKQIRHANLLPVWDVWVLDEEGNAWRAANEGEVASARPIELVVATPLADQSLWDRFRALADAGEAFPLEELLNHMEDAARGIDHLNHPIHVLGGQEPATLWRCDIKPSNILLAGDSAQVGDVGWAQLSHGDSSQAKTGVVLGSLAYMAPECAAGRPTRASDQYSLAITYYETRTGALPFAPEDRQSAFGLLAAHAQGRLDLSRLPPAEREVIRKATSVDPAQRYGSAREMVQALRRAAHGEIPLQPPLPSPKIDFRGTMMTAPAVEAERFSASKQSRRTFEAEGPPPMSRAPKGRRTTSMRILWIFVLLLLLWALFQLFGA